MDTSGSPFSNAGRHLRRILYSPASWLWVVVVMAIQIRVAARGGPEDLGWCFENFGLSRDGLRAGKIWQIGSYGLLHGAWWHAALNGLIVLVIGSRVEHMAGRPALMRTMAAGVLAGGLCHVWFGAGLLVGLSGGCLALLLLLTTLSPQSRMFPLPVSGKSLGFGILAAALILALMNPDLDLPGFSAAGRALVDQGMGSWFQIGHACHFGGGLAGWLYGRWMLRPRVTLDSLRRDRARREAE
ncbi:MAG: rhomboid family intramembrane serine protease [Luteolibacter sp.]|jgi:membrane associated rhomboid family serine protease|nr:rhomboid family intramembrane serine protease [Luteolibacter sp.]